MNSRGGEALVITHIFWTLALELIIVLHRPHPVPRTCRVLYWQVMTENTLLPAAQWAQNEFGFAQLGDKRRNQRLVKIASHLAAHPGGTMPQAFPDWAELKAAYRFFSQKGVQFASVITPHLERTRTVCSAPGEYLIIEDTTLLDFSRHSATKHLGVIGDGGGRGFELHSALAVRVEAWTLNQRPEGTIVGLFGQHCSRPRPAPRDESRHERLSRPRKSQRWAQAFKEAGRPPEKAQWIYIADWESDFYEPMQTCQQHGVDFIIRGYQDRRLANGAGHLHQALASAPVLGQMTVELRSRPGQPARTAMVQIRAAPVDLDGPWRPGGWQAPLPALSVIEVTETGAGDTVEPLHWILLTSLPCTRWVQAQRIVGRYIARWWIEEYHKALKSGVGVEESQLSEAGRLESLIGILAVVAVRLLNAKMLARSRPDSMEAAASFGTEVLAVLEARFGPPKGGWCNQNVIMAIARLGGFLARKHDGMPGWQTIWRGWQRLFWMCEGVATLITR
jgi:hypothetical protein